MELQYDPFVLNIVASHVQPEVIKCYAATLIWLYMRFIRGMF